jgi:acetoin utilization deacetylase AcuC-like enzyme
MEVFYSDHYTIPLPENHRFPMEKYKLLKNYLLESKILKSEELRQSPLATQEHLLLAHTKDYVLAMKTGSVSSDIIKRIGFPWSPELYTRICATVGGAIEASKSAVKNKISGNLAGGTHHSHADRGEGYCVFNDIAVATRFLKKERLAERIAIVDLDVHQGNGNSSILKDDPNIFIFSMHGEKNYPFHKIPSHLDIALPEGIEDEEYLNHLVQGMDQVRTFEPDYIFYQMGVDPLKEDTLGKMSLSHEGLMRRDELVLRFAKSRQIPISLALGGGYANPIALSVQAYANTYRVAKWVFENAPSPLPID